jgi:hypothetical protein
VPPPGARSPTGHIERADRLASRQRRGYRHGEDPPGPPLQIVIFSLRHGENGIDAIRTVTAPPRGIMGPSTGSIFRFFPPTSCAFVEHALNDAPGNRMRKQPSKAWPLGRELMHRTHPPAHLSRYSCVKASGSQAFSRSRRSTRRILPEMVFGRFIELDTPDALIGRKVSVGMGESCDRSVEVVAVSNRDVAGSAVGCSTSYWIHRYGLLT